MKTLEDKTCLETNNPSPEGDDATRRCPLLPCPLSPPVNDPAQEMDELVKAAARGDRRAIGAIAVAFGPTLLRIAMREAGPGQDAEDVVQDIYVHLLEGRGARFPPGKGRGLAWLGGLVRALARARRRGARDRL